MRRTCLRWVRDDPILLLLLLLLTLGGKLGRRVGDAAQTLELPSIASRNNHKYMNHSHLQN